MAAPRGDPIALALRVAGIFEALGVRYLLGGSLASTTHGCNPGTWVTEVSGHMGNTFQ